MPSSESWPVASPLSMPRLLLEPLHPGHATEAFSVFNDARLHTWTGGTPRSLAQLEDRYARQAKGSSPDGTQGWLNWMLRRTSDGRLVGTVQSTLSRPAGGCLEATLAWVVGFAHQGNGYGREGALAMTEWLRARGVGRLVAYIHPRHEASMGIARALGLTASDVVVDGEIRWSRPGR
ncbi:GNAT family N-acetyltransferase [Streptomyces sp. AV19]|uniref:GNAT family N-acetyltransferase n=1 Tax=Streptomyces sp. AV19 TaxID=2793068 RepID=UPI0018FE4436|nr:GNAT family N-acetyltransferase [Streptomyces sp. AV19]MBH1935952.1 GNAT family N-acetyltransferase [Streptomyces sp. AV19]MDG4534259.1 GNAT family N-acetyltransferase [Streptomyces sp. AV19]